MTDIIDSNVLGALKESLGDDDEFLAELIETFLQDSPEQLTAIRGAFGSADAEIVRRSAHSLKSNSASFGAMSLSALCKQLEDLGKHGDLVGAEALLPEVENAYAAVERELRKLL
jgi:two-component system sensor histidine kinase/response regulator